MLWNIVADSSCDLKSLQIAEGTQGIKYDTVPFVITVGGEDYVDDEKIDLNRMLGGIEREKTATHTSCPSPGSWLEMFSREGNVIAITISGQLSGSFNSACAAAEMLRHDEPDKKIAVIDSYSAGAGLVMLVNRITEWIEEGKSFEEVVFMAHEMAEKKRTIFALCSFHNLIKNGRMSPIAGFAAQKLKFWGIGIGTKHGEIKIKGKARGAKKMLQAIVTDIQEFGSPIQRVYICHCQNLQMAQQLKEEILARWKNVVIEVHETRGLCSYYAERHGLIVSYL